MARLPRLYAPGVVQHVVQRPVDARVLFDDAADYRFFVDLLSDAVRELDVALHAYVLMPGQMRFLLTPPDDGALPRLVQALGRRYVPYLNRRLARSGPLWDRRYRSTLVDADALLLASMQRIETLPVAEGLVGEPAAWPWSSYAHHAGFEQQSVVSDHRGYWALSDTPFERQAIYRAALAAPLGIDAAARIDDAVDRGWALGSPAFAEGLDGIANRRTAPLIRGRKRR